MSKRRRVILSAVSAAAVAVAAVTVATAAGPNPAPATQALTRSCVTDGGGYCAVTHGLGVTPEAISLSEIIPAGGTPYKLFEVAGSKTATTVRVRAIRISNGSAYTNAAITFSLVTYDAAPPPPTTVTTTTAPTTSTTPPVTTTTTPPPAGCALPAYPDATCTGVPAGVALTVVNGDMTINTAGTVVDGKDIRGCVTVHAPGVVIRNSKISAACGYVVDSYGYTGTGLVIEDSEVFCPPGNGGTAIGEDNVTVRRLDVSGCENGFDVDKSFTIEDSYIHDLYQSAEAHTDGVQMWSTVDGVTIRHNTIIANTGGVDGTSAIISASSGTANVLIESNLMAGGADTLYCRQAGAGTNYRVINNHFSTRFHPTVGAFGPWTDCEDEAQVTGNVYHETGQPLPF